MTQPRTTSGAPRPLLEQAPVGRQLTDVLSESQIKAMWQRIDHAPAAGVATRWWVALALAAVIALVVGFFQSAPGGESQQLALTTGAIPSVFSSESVPSAAHFSDGSQVVLLGSSRLEVLRNDARSFVTALRRGSASFEVKPGGGRHWVVEAGELSVEVVGTRFRVERSPDIVRVSVDHGIVTVRGERVLGGSIRLTAGKSFELPLAPETRAIGRTAPSTSAPPPEPVAPLSSTDAPPVATANPAVTSARREDSDDVDGFLRSADKARAEADPNAAIRAFDAAWRRAAPGDARRGLAALSLARLLIAQDPAKAAQVLRSSLADMPPALLEDASARLVEAESRAGNREAAATAAADYLRRFPAGRRAAEVRRWSEP